MKRFDFNVRDYGAVGNAAKLDTAAIQHAIDAAAEQGGRVIVPPGVYLCGSLILKSHVTLEVQRGAKILGSPNLDDYQIIPWVYFSENLTRHLIYAEDAKQVAITGEGEINGHGAAFWNSDRPSAFHFFTPLPKRVFPMIEFVRCQHVRLENIALRDSPSWTVHLHDCDHALLRALTIRSSLFGPNTDGIDLTGCRDVIISDCDISTGDDAIALKTAARSRSCERITIANCLLETSCVALRIGYESVQAFRDITATNLVVKSCSRIVDLRTIEGCDIERIRIQNVVATTNSAWPINRPIEIFSNAVPSMLTPRKPIAGPEGEAQNYTDAFMPGKVRDISLSGFDILTDGRITLIGTEKVPPENISLRDIRVRYAMLDDPQPIAATAHSVGFMPGPFMEERGARAAIVASNIRNLHLSEIEILWPTYPVPADWQLLSSPHRLFKGQEEAVRDGHLKTPISRFLGQESAGHPPGHCEFESLPIRYRVRGTAEFGKPGDEFRADNMRLGTRAKLESRFSPVLNPE